MAYNKQKLFNEAIEVTKKYKLYNIEDIVAYLPCAKPTFYELFPLESNEMNAIKDLCENNKIMIKTAIRAKLLKSDKAAELISLYKLVGTDNERKALSMQSIDHTTKGESLNNKTGFEITIIDPNKPDTN